MSDLFRLREKISSGKNWRGSISVEIDEETIELTIRQLLDGEFFKVMKMIDKDELQSLRDELPDGKMEEYRELQDAEDLSDSERERLNELTSELEEQSSQLFETLSESTYNGIVQAGKYGVVPDKDDLAEIVRNHAREYEEKYNITVRSTDDVKEYVEEETQEMLAETTDFVGFMIGMEVLNATLDEKGN